MPVFHRLTFEVIAVVPVQQISTVTVRILGKVCQNVSNTPLTDCMWSRVFSRTHQGLKLVSGSDHLSFHKWNPGSWSSWLFPICLHNFLEGSMHTEDVCLIMPASAEDTWMCRTRESVCLTCEDLSTVPDIYSVFGPTRTIVWKSNGGFIHPFEYPILVLIWYSYITKSKMVIKWHLNSSHLLFIVSLKALKHTVCRVPDNPIQISGMSTWWKSGRFPLMKNCSSWLHRGNKTNTTWGS